MAQRVYWRFDRDIPSDGMTTDTPRGPVDLVAVDRALAGHPVRLSPAEGLHLFSQLGGDHVLADTVAQALGVGLEAVLRRTTRAKQRVNAAS